MYLILSARKITGTTPDFRMAGKILATALFCAVIVLAIEQFSMLGGIPTLILCMVVFGLAYVTLLPLLNIITLTDTEIFWQMFSKFKILRPILKAVNSYINRILKIRHTVRND